MSRLLDTCTVAPRGAGPLFAAYCGLSLAFGYTPALAQSTALTYPDPFAPQLETVPQKFEKQAQSNPGTTGLPRTFQPVAPLPSGAGSTGYNASNAKLKPARQTTITGVDANAQTVPSAVPPISPYQQPIPPLPGDEAAGADANAQAPAPSPLSKSPYQQPIPPLPSDVAGTPGAPPVGAIGPVRKLPTKRNKAHPDEPIDPYAPAGIHAGAFDIYPAIEFIGGYDTNPGQTQGGKGAALYTVAPEVHVQSDWSRHELQADLRGSYTGYSPDAEPTLSRPYLNGRVDGRIDVSHDNRINLGSSVLVSTDNPGSPNLQAGLAKLPVFVDFGGTAGFTHSFNRFELGITGGAERISYQHSVLTDGTTVSNTDRNYNQFSGALRGSYELTPGIKPFVEIGTDARIHDVEPDENGYLRNSKGITGKVGMGLALTNYLTGQVAVGYTHRTYADPRFGPLGGLIGDASLIWTADALNTVTLTAASSVGESTIPGVSGILYRNVGLQFDHAFRQWLIGTLKLGLGVDTYKGGSTDSSGLSPICDCVITTPGETAPDRRDLRYLIGLGLTYKINRELQLKGEFQQNWVRSNVAGADYDESIFLLGLRAQR